ncbi:aspartate/glutamate racemase family protein [Radiobacillus sp. PE A8.2]|uniref:aspartate/glutamate racemase family protein n=1 Tax=Radiobacillus sp. PE A8.2 TaxID=3380349 RepID=UPI00388FC0FB
MKEFFGIIGGLGPKATVSFYENIVDRTVAERDQEHPEFLLFNHTTIPDRTDYIMDNSMPNPLPYLIEDVKKLSDAKASFIVIPCNTAHYFYEELQRNSAVPIINMISETAKYIIDYSPDVKKVGILGTPGTLKANLYQKELEKVDLEPVLPTDNIQDDVNRLIFDQAKQGTEIDYSLYLDVLKSMLDLGCDTVILGCTELSLIDCGVVDHPFPIVDAQAVLAEKSILLSGKQVKKLHADERNRLVRVAGSKE